MFNVIDFIKNYWFLILPGVEILCTLLILLIRKKPVKVVDTLKEVIVRVLPALIVSAENYKVVLDGVEHSLSGKDKLSFVLRELAKVLKELNYGDDVIAQYLPFATEQVELILSTPQKKGIKL